MIYFSEIYGIILVFMGRFYTRFYNVENCIYRTLIAGLLIYQIFVYLNFVFLGLNESYRYHLNIIHFRYPPIEFILNGFCMLFLILHNLGNIGKDREVNNLEKHDALKSISLVYSVSFLIFYINPDEYDSPYFSNIFVINFWLEIFMITFYPIIRELIRILFQYIHKKVWENIIKEQSKQNNDTKLKNVTEIV